MSKNDREIEVQGQHNAIKVAKYDPQNGLRNTDPRAAWFPKAGLGLFIHWGISAVGAQCDLSWGMIDGWEFANRTATEEELREMNKPFAERKIGKRFTPNQYFALAKDFDGRDFDADALIRAAKAAGFTYAVLTTRHHDGFALWPSKYGSFNVGQTCNRDFVREFVDACRTHGLKVGLYYSPPDWHFNRDYMSFLIYTAKRKNPGLPELDADYNPVVLPDAEAMAAQNARYGAYVAGQIEELLTQYGKVDLLWFDGSMPAGQIYPLDKIRALQPGIVVNHRLHGTGDFETCEVREAQQRPHGWWEFCTQWPSKGWAYMDGVPYRPLSEISAEYARTIAWGGNYLLDVGPMGSGALPPEAEEKLREFSAWRAQNADAFTGVSPLSETCSCTCPAVQKGNTAYLFIQKDCPEMLSFSAPQPVVSAHVLDNGEPVAVAPEADGRVQLARPASLHNGAVRVIVLTLAQ